MMEEFDPLDEAILTFSSEYRLSELDSGEPDRFVRGIEGSLVIPAYPDKPGDRVIGHVSLLLFQGGEAMNAKEILYDVADAHSEDMEEAFAAVFDWRTGLHTKGIEELYAGDIMGTDLLLIRGLEIDREYRGKGLGSKVLSAVKTTFGANASLILLKPFPTEYLRLDEKDQEQRKAEFYEDSKRLIAYYQKHGFRSIPGTELMSFNPSLLNQPAKAKNCRTSGRVN